MTERIKKLTDLVLQGKMYVEPVSVSLESNEGESRIGRESRHLCEYILAQEPKINEHIAFTGRFNFDGSVVGDAFKRGGHKYNQMALEKYYLKPQENLSTMEWQHATADYKRVLEAGMLGILEIARLSYFAFDGEKAELAKAFINVGSTIIKWAEQTSKKVREFTKGIKDEDAKKRLTKLANALIKVPKHPAESFYEAVLTIFVCFSADPDSVGTLDRYLTPYYERDIANGTLTRDEAKEYLQELFLMLQASTPISSIHFTRGGESHFCIGGYLPNGEDGFNELSRLIAESLVELPTYIPQVTFRWTNKTPKDALRYMMDLERRDPHKRIAFTNDEKRIKCYTEICGIPYERAVSYTTVGCNEPALVGAITGSTSKGNVLRSVETLFHKKQNEIINVKTFEEFYKAFECELRSDIEKIFEYDDLYNSERAKDYNYISSLFFHDCVESATSLTMGGGKSVIASPMLMGITNVIDSLIVVKQFVFDEKLFDMKTLIDALENDWGGYEDLRTTILKKGKFFGNDDELSGEVSKMYYQSLYNIYKDRKNLFGYQWLVGDLLGYNEHHNWFGQSTKATPDGRRGGDLLKFGIGQSEGKDKEGLGALLNAIATLDENAIACGSTVTNVSLDKNLVTNDESFEKLVTMFEAYFKNGGVHFQLTYASKEDLINAKKNPHDYRSLRVRVTGFSDYFVKLKESIQDDIISRTEKK